VKRLVLAGAGHAHALLLLDLIRAPLPGTELVVVSPHAQAPYSGMVPGWLAGRYAFDEIGVDFPRLCAAAGARWLADEVDALDPARRRLRLAGGEELGYDLLSLNVGSTLRPPPAARATVLALRPLADLRSRYEALLQRWSADASTAPCTVTAVGAGAAGFESLLAVLARLRALRPDRTVHGRLVGRGATLLPELAAPARRAATRALAAAGVSLQLGTAWSEALDRDGDVVLWATGAEAQAWQRDPARRGALAVDEAGFVRIDASLRSVSHPQVFAAGDCARFEPGPLPKAGVYAVRMGPVLARNLRAACGAPGGFTRYRPQRRFLALLATGDGRAIASRGPFGGAGAWAWRWKDSIDRGFLARFGPAGAQHRPLAPPPAGPPGVREAIAERGDRR
jgi:pyridine nucleotide-disulfide oxidoreductase family protein